MDKRSKRSDVAKELAALYKQHGGLDPKRVVEWARKHKASELHSRFEWDNSAAAEQYRIWQARELITEVEVVYPDKKVRQVYVSPMESRGPRGAGYQALSEVISDADRRAAFLEQALAEYERLGNRYADLQELAEVQDAVGRARKNAAFRRAKAA